MHHIRKAVSSLRSGAVFLAAFAALNWGAQVSRSRLEKRQAAELLIDDAFQRPDRTARYDRSGGEDLDRFWRYIPDARTHPLAVLVGMSQMYSINDRAAEDLTIVEWLDDALEPLGSRAFGLAAPNLDNEEAILYLLAIAAKPETKPAAFIYGVCFDKFRNIDVRPGLERFARRRPELLRDWADTAARHQLTHPAAAEKMLGTLRAIAAAAPAADDSTFEALLRRTAADIFPLVGARTVINAQIFGSLYELRNAALGIKASTKRPIIGARYELNRELMDLLADEASLRGIVLLPYIIPLNPTADTPYIASEYAAFKVWFQNYAKDHALHAADLDSIVPPSEWGTRNGEPDFKHFRGAGHRVTADAVLEAFRAELVR